MASLKFDNVYIKDYFTLVGPKEKESKINNFDISINDYYYKTKTFEMAEIKMQRVVIESLINNNNMCDRNFDYLIGGDLINQISISSYSAKEFRIPYIGVYSACATFVEEMLLASNLIQSKNAKNIICITSSHNLTAERQFRYPNEYGNSKPSTATSTATCAVGSILTNEKHSLKITSGTIGKVVDLGINDVNHMGAVMAPACADTLNEHLTNLNLKPKDYDLILTGDLGCIGLDILKEYYENVYKEKITNIMDAGCEIYLNSQEMYAGGSGPCCLPLVFFCKILKSKRYKKILLLGTGSLHSPVLVNQHQTIPSVCHAISIEVES
ncbi:MAG: stage V sporulation protein AD [Firmicutes bacterium]|nr:stage V sporulation protein AD [Bacillota bacterium]